MALDVVDGHKVSLAKDAPDNGKALYFINLGGYAEGAFTELHANMIVVAKDAAEAKARAKSELMQGGESEVHTDDLYDIDDCLEVGKGRAVARRARADGCGWRAGAGQRLPHHPAGGDRRLRHAASGQSAGRQLKGSLLPLREKADRAQVGGEAAAIELGCLVRANLL